MLCMQTFLKHVRVQANREFQLTARCVYGLSPCTVDPPWQAVALWMCVPGQGTADKMPLSLKAQVVIDFMLRPQTVCGHSLPSSGNKTKVHLIIKIQPKSFYFKSF